MAALVPSVLNMFRWKWNILINQLALEISAIDHNIFGSLRWNRVYCMRPKFGETAPTEFCNFVDSNPENVIQRVRCGSICVCSAWSLCGIEVAVSNPAIDGNHSIEWQRDFSAPIRPFPLSSPPPPLASLPPSPHYRTAPYKRDQVYTFQKSFPERFRIRAKNTPFVDVAASRLAWCTTLLLLLLIMWKNYYYYVFRIYDIDLWTQNAKLRAQKWGGTQKKITGARTENGKRRKIRVWKLQYLFTWKTYYTHLCSSAFAGRSSFFSLSLSRVLSRGSRHLRLLIMGIISLKCCRFFSIALSFPQLVRLLGRTLVSNPVERKLRAVMRIMFLYYVWCTLTITLMCAFAKIQIYGIFMFDSCSSALPLPLSRRSRSRPFYLCIYAARALSRTHSHERGSSE